LRRWRPPDNAAVARHRPEPFNAQKLDELRRQGAQGLLDHLSQPRLERPAVQRPTDQPAPPKAAFLRKIGVRVRETGSEQ
jgi:hypothetical protein